ncbi:MAG: tRNA glutamyl-Q(34) synthetase GluQRS [Oleibacter sp.]|nr:tRNA glutamyl-Q(34) synthetase GluQRS [Thalassolituus sp.]
MSSTSDFSLRSSSVNHPLDRLSPYVGRFAPSPTGPLHFGSLLAALVSYLDARAHQGQWLLRIEDLDPPREDPTATDHILTTLDAFGLHWDGEVSYQSQRTDLYEDALAQLIVNGTAFACTCSRSQLAGKPHLGHCQSDTTAPHAWRFLCPTQALTVHDRWQPSHTWTLPEDIGDFVIRRRDGLWSYQLAVVVDDADQGITHVVRGIDLLDSGVRQQLLQHALNLPSPSYAHLPVATELSGQKLSKQNHALALDSHHCRDVLCQALQWLKQGPPADLSTYSVEQILSWAVQHWQPNTFAQQTSWPAPQGFCQPVS